MKKIRKSEEFLMQLYMPTKVYSDKNCVKKHGKEMVSYGSKAMVVTGKHSSRMNGSLADVEEVLKNENVPYIVFDDVEENPSIETIMEAKAIGLAGKVDFVIGIGGGSPLDASKAIALMIANPEETEEVFYQPKKLPNLPVICIPTTCGTGSEVTPYSILTIHKGRTKKSISHRIFPELALMDAEYLKSMSRTNLVNTATDALGHLIESYLNVNSNEWNCIYVREGLRVFADFKERLQLDLLLDDDYEKMLRTSSWAGMAIAHTQTSLPHGLSYALTYECNIPHGRAVGLFLAGYVNAYEDRKAVSEVMELLGFSNTEQFSNYMYDLLGSEQVEAELLEKTANDLMKDTGKLKNYPFNITKEELMQMYQK